MGLTYDSIHSDNLIIRRITPPLLPPIEPRVITVPGRPGVLYAGHDYGPREISVQYTMLRNTRTALLSAMQVVAAWLQPRQPAPLEFDDDVGKYYMAIVAGSTPMELINTRGEGQLTFYCPDPFLYGAEVSAPDGDITVDGSYKTYPRFEVAFTETETEFIVVAPSGQYVRVVQDFVAGDVLEIDCARALVVVNGVRALEFVDLSSDFFALEIGRAHV